MNCVFDRFCRFAFCICLNDIGDWDCGYKFCKLSESWSAAVDAAIMWVKPGDSDWPGIIKWCGWLTY